MNRRLAAILAADVVGYSRMMGSDEVGTMADVKKLRTAVMEPLLRSHDGRLIKTTGDGFLLEFGSVHGAFGFACQVQSRLVGSPLQLRMGLNVGDVILDEGDVFGDGVNVAARLEPLAPPGGLLVSQRAWEDLRRLPITFEDRGELELKNIKEPIRCWGLAPEQLAAHAAAITVDEDAVVETSTGTHTPTEPGVFEKSRRRLLMGGGLGFGALAIGGGLWAVLGSPKKAPPEVAALLAQAWQAWTQGTLDGNAQALGLYRRAIELSPDFADSWGLLSCAYGDRGHGLAGAERDATWQRAREAGQRALSLDPANAYGRMGVAYARPLRGNWGLMEREFRRAEKDQPGKFLVNYSLGLLLGDVGRYAEAAQLFASLKGTAPTAMQYLWHSQALWACGKLDEADRLIEEASGIFGSHPAIWRQRFDMALHSGRITSAIAQVEDVQARPESIDADFVDVAMATAHAALSREPGAVAEAMTSVARYARISASRTGASIEFASLLRQFDAAFDIAAALFFSTGFSIPDSPSRGNAAPTVTMDQRRTRLLFLPSTAGMRADKRFDVLARNLALVDYWRASGSKPDYQST